MLDLIIKSPVRRKILGLFALNPDHELYAGQIAKEINESPYAVGLELKQLVKGGLLKSVERGKSLYYQWNEAHPIAKPLQEIFTKLLDQGDQEMRSLPALEQRERIQKNLERVTRDIQKYYDPEKLILFGSTASGKIHPSSDIDLLVIKKTALPYFERLEQLVDLLDYDVDIDFLVYTPDEFAKAVAERPFFQNEIMKNGKILYEKAA